MSDIKGKAIDFTPTTSVDTWAADAKALADLPEGKAWQITGDKGARTAFQRAARVEGITARVVASEEIGEGKFTFTFVAAELRTREVKPKDAEAEAEAAEVADAE